MAPEAHTFLTIGAFLILALVADYLGRRTALPRVTLLLLIGVLAGPSVLDVVPQQQRETFFPAISVIALVMIGFLLGADFDREQIRRSPFPAEGS